MKIRSTVLLMSLMVALTAFGQGETTMEIGYCDDTSATAIGDSEKGVNVAAVEFDAEFLQQYVGNRITAIVYQLGASFGSDGSVFLAHSLNNDIDNPSNFIREYSIPDFDYVPCYKWLEVALDEPIVIEEGKSIFAGIRILPYKSAPYYGTYQFAVDDNAAASTHSYMYSASAKQWKPVSSYSFEDCANPSFLIRLRVEGSGLPTNDVSVSDLKSVEYLRTSETCTCSYIVTNCATNDIESFDAELLVDGVSAARKHETLATPLKMKESATFEFADIHFGAEGTHTLTIVVSQPNGVADTHPENNSQSKTISVIDRYFKHYVLAEAFTTMSCANCPNAHVREDAAFEGVTDVVRVDHHSGFGTDALTTEADKAYLWFYNNGGTTYAPGMMFDRRMIDDFFDTQRSPGEEHSPIVGPGDPENILFIHNYLAAEPAYVDVHIQGDYDKATRKLKVTVSGDVIAHLGGTSSRINVWLTESGLSAAENRKYRQITATGEYDYTYVHNNAMRETLTGNWGESISLPLGSYSRTFSTTLDESWVAGNMDIVAFISNYDANNPDNCRIYNCASLPIASLLEEGVTLHRADQTQAVGVYDLQGRRLHNSIKRGLYIKDGRPVLMK